MQKFPMLFLSLLLFQSASASFHVVIDPGHGGTDIGASRDSFVESKIVLAIAEKIKASLKENAVTADVIETTLTRETDSNLSLQQRVRVANELNADLFVSLHANSSTSAQVSGFEFYFASNQAQVETEKVHSTKPLAIIEKIKSDLITLGRQKQSLAFSQQMQQESNDKKSVIRRAPFYVIENTAMPAVLIEVGFISNRREAKKLSTPEYQSEIATLLTKSILSYKEKSDKKLSLNEK